MQGRTVDLQWRRPDLHLFPVSPLEHQDVFPETPFFKLIENCRVTGESRGKRG
jgi:hypothetical protein